MLRKLAVLLPALVLFLYFAALFYRVLLHDVWPFPGDVLVSYFYPWNSGGWAGWHQGIFHKEVIASDVFRMYLPWKSLGVDIVKSGHLPLWNPYNFAGTPLLANFQSAFFYPFGLPFYFLPLLPAWVFYLALQPIIAFSGMYLYLRLITKSRFSACIGALGFISTGFMLTWFDWGIVGHAAAWMGWLLFVCHQIFWEGLKKYRFLMPALVAFAILSGYPQITLLIFLTSFAYALIPFIKRKTNRFGNVLQLIGLFLWGAILTSIQLVPTLKISHFSARGMESAAIFSKFDLPLPSLITIFSPDYFGNIAVGNFWGMHHYQEHMAYFGVALIPLILLALFNFKNDLKIKFFSIVAVLSIVLVLPTPLVEIVKIIPIMSSGIPTRTLFLFQTSMVILAAMGLDRLILGNAKKIEVIKVVVFTAFVYVELWILTILIPNYFPTLTNNLAIARHNLIIPTVLVFLSLTLILTLSFKVLKYWLVISVLIVMMALEASYFFNKFAPFSPRNYFFPSHPLITDLSNLASVQRAWGYGTGYVIPNFESYYRYQTTDGYDPLYIERYGELLSSIGSGKLGPSLKRADANLPQKYSPNLIKIARLIGVSYYAFNFDDEQKHNDPMWSEFLASAKPIRSDFWPISQDLGAYPRAFLAGEYLTATTQEKIIERMFDSRVDLSKTLILEKNLGKALDKQPGEVNITDYQATVITIKTKSDGNNLLFLSDNYYPGWNAYVDGKKSEVYRTDYTFRSVYVPKGEHEVVFKYEPASIKIGLALTALSLLAYAGWVYGWLWGKRHKTKTG